MTEPRPEYRIVGERRGEAGFVHCGPFGPRSLDGGWEELDRLRRQGVANAVMQTLKDGEWVDLEEGSDE